jgi:L-serine dehydratase
MRAASFFVDKLREHEHFSRTTKVKVELFGSLALTGIGHGTDRAVLAGLEGEKPEITSPEKVMTVYKRIFDAKDTDSDSYILLGGQLDRKISFNYKRDLIFTPKALPYHPNGMMFSAYQGENLIYQKTFYSVGGGFIVGKKMAEQDKILHREEVTEVPFPYKTAKDLVDYCKKENKSMSEITLMNELSWRTPLAIDEKLGNVWHTMNSCIQAGLVGEGDLPGRLQVKRRAKLLHAQLRANPVQALRDPLTIMDWVSLYALAVNEENAAGGRVVTAPTNGAAGIVPAVLKYHEQFCHHAGFPDVKKYLMTAGTIGILYKMNASISGAEVGCQGEVGVACSMAAAGLAELMGGNPEQVENDAEIGMEHNLGLTCDPVEGQVQIPCIERNAMAAVKAINAARMALRGSGKHYISLDQVMQTMKQTGHDMQSKYKETSQGGLAVNITEC